MQPRVERLARGWIVGLVATTVAAVSHSLAGGYRPGALSFGVALVFAGLLGTAVIGSASRPPSLVRLIVAVGGAQLAFHLLFSLLGGGHDGAVGPHGPMHMELPVGMVSGMPHPLPSATTAMPAHLADPGMWTAHALAAALTIVFLRRAELAIWTMLTRLGRVVVARLVVVVVAVTAFPPSTRPAPLLAPRPLRDRLLASVARRRGPPLPAF